MELKILYYGLIQNSVGKREEQLTLPAGAKASQLVDALAEKYGQGFKDNLLDVAGGLRANVTILLDNTSVSELEGLDTEINDVKEASIVVTIPQFGGG
ncbi:MAG: MoaD/ThiS family protein [Thermodesulfobacteriota bacterium]